MCDWFTKPGYRSRPNPEYFVDELVDEGVVHQPDVYVFAAHLARRWGCDTIIDIGCGRGHKLGALHESFHIVGIDYGENIDFCRSQHAFGEWIRHDLESNLCLPIPAGVAERSVIVCSDVIEHLVDPSHLLRELARLLSDAPVAVLTTPERDRARGPDDLGPPGNPHHVREWNLSEFCQLLDHTSLSAPLVGLTRSNDLSNAKSTILALCESLDQGRPGPAPDAFRVLAILASYNEEDIIVPSIEELLRQGVEVAVIDNWSTDSTFHKARDVFSGRVHVERFPAAAPGPYFDWTAILARKQEIADESGADWCIHHDLDEVRRSPWRGVGLREALWQVEKRGFNAVDHTVLQFFPTDNHYRGGTNFEKHFHHFRWGTRTGERLQVKAWKNHQSTDLTQSGGHDVRFDGRRVFPVNFTLKHYPLRTSRQGRQKILDRRERISPHERHWHNHYDGLLEDSVLQWAPETLLSFDEASFDVEWMTERLGRVGAVFNESMATPVPR